MRQLDKTGVYIDKTEVTIAYWSEYVWSMYMEYGADSEQFIATKCDSVVFREQYGHVFLYPYTQGLGKMDKYGFTSEDIRFKVEEYDKHPMVGLTYEQCLAFCRWRTERYNSTVRKKVRFRMPSSEELRVAADNRRINIPNDVEREYASDARTSKLGSFRCAATFIHD